MYDWNHNGKHDAFDDAMFMALLEDDLERHPPKKTYRSSSSSSSFFEEMGCLLYLGFLIILPLSLLVMFLFYGEWDLVLLLIMITVLVHVGLYMIIKGVSSDHKPEKPNTQPNQAVTSTNAPKEPAPSATNAPALKEFRYDNYDVLAGSGIFRIKKFVGVDKAVQEVPAILNDVPVRVIEEGAYRNCRLINKVIIRNGIDEICDRAFEGCSNLKEVVIPESVTKIGPDAFPHGQGIVLYCYGSSYGLEYARRYKFEYKDAENANDSVKKADSKTEGKPEDKFTYTSAKSTSGSSYTPGYIPLYTPSYTSSSVLDDEPEETVRERLDYDLIGTGYDSYDLEWMDEDERNQILEDNLLDPYDYDFDDLD